jgi:hypothetical protein
MQHVCLHRFVSHVHRTRSCIFHDRNKAPEQKLHTFQLDIMLHAASLPVISEFPTVPMLALLMVGNESCEGGKVSSGQVSWKSIT